MKDFQMYHGSLQVENLLLANVVIIRNERGLEDFQKILNDYPFPFTFPLHIPSISSSNNLPYVFINTPENWILVTSEVQAALSQALLLCRENNDGTY